MFYRLKHLPTGLYFRPSREVKIKMIFDGRINEGWVKSNLSKAGKLYGKKPTLKYIGALFYSHVDVEWKQRWIGNFYAGGFAPKVKTIPFDASEWEIEENK